MIIWVGWEPENHLGQELSQPAAVLSSQYARLGSKSTFSEQDRESRCFLGKVPGCPEEDHGLGREIVQSVKCLLRNCEDLSVISRRHVGKEARCGSRYL